MKVEWMLVISISATLIFVCYTDILRRKITNGTTSLILFFSLLLAFYRLDNISFLPIIILFFIGFICSTVGVIGAGDVKLVCALSTALSTTEMGNFLLLTGVFGIPLSLLTWLYYKVLSKQKLITIPYGVAICCGYWMLWVV